MMNTYEKSVITITSESDRSSCPRGRCRNVLDMLMSSLIDEVESIESDHGNVKNLYEKGDARG